MQYTHFLWAVVFLFGLGITAEGKTPPMYQNTSLQNVSENSTSPQSAYRDVISVAPQNIVVPTVVEVPLVGMITARSVMAIEQETGRNTSAHLIETYSTTPELVTAYSDTTNAHVLVDENLTTGALYPIDESREGRTRIILSTQKPITSSNLLLHLEKNVALPTTVEIRTRDQNASEAIILAQTRVLDTNISFIPTTATEWLIDVTYAQPLKINELTLVQDAVEANVYRAVRILAQPGMTYDIYLNPDRFVNVQSTGANLLDDDGVVRLSPHTTGENPEYVQADSDDDSISDYIDNCVLVSNPDQIDVNRNGKGDACEDFDRDGIQNDRDNCVELPNRDQYDTDGDGKGDACDEEESRLTERLPWVPWVGMGIAGVVLAGLFVLVARRQIPHTENQ